ncbi:hypothetical protein J6590_037282 [Homalodisca vitripennis]|nr:hypothetical protein J6590_037282 [Homalodisca vitripennis]
MVISNSLFFFPPSEKEVMVVIAALQIPKCLASFCYRIQVLRGASSGFRTGERPNSLVNPLPLKSEQIGGNVPERNHSFVLPTDILRP